MSGFVGILNGDGQPIDSTLLQQMTDLMVLQCPDGQDTWSNGHIGLGHALLRTTWESENERQPYSLDEKMWITGDIRLDRRDELITQLRASGCQLENSVPDVNLVLHAYHVWGEACLERLGGDFAFAIWDTSQQRLFCARDHFGIVPFYYAEKGSILIFSSHIQCLQRHPKVSDRLNEQTIGDLLLFGMNSELTTTTFADIQKLPPAHTLIFSAGKVHIQRYWQLPDEGEYLRYKRPEDYVEQFKELFERAIADRLRTDRAGTHLSGGMDSTSIAATTYQLMKADNSSIDFRAYSIVYKELIEDDEGDYATQVAEKAGFPIEFLVAEDYIKQVPLEHPEYPYPEPLFIPNQIAEVEIMRRIAGYSRVLLVGFGGDPAFYPSLSYWPHLLKTGQVRYFMRDILGYIQTRRLPRIGLYTQLRRWFSIKKPKIEIPEWFNPDFVERMQLKARLQEALMAQPQRDRCGMTVEPLWSNIFAWSHPGFSGFPVKVRFPFFDLHLVSYLQSIPTVPWFENKFLLREAMKDVLPDSVRLRPKTLLRGFPHYNFMQQQGLQPWMEKLVTTPMLEPYVCSKQLLQTWQERTKLNLTNYNQTISVLPLAYWLKHQTIPENRKLLIN